MLSESISFTIKSHTFFWGDFLTGFLIKKKFYLNTEIKNAIQAADSEAQYDESAKRLLAQKYVLAHILVRTVEEFQGMEIEKVVSLIEGDPYISKVPVASGLTNKDKNVEGKRIVGLNTEAGEKNEGLVRFDIIFYVRMRNGLAQMIINVEAHKEANSR